MISNYIAYRLFKQPIKKILINSTYRYSTKSGYHSNSYTGKPTTFDTGSRLEIYVPTWSRRLNFSYVWLRDHCKCDKCYNGNTFQRLQDICSIPFNICPVSVDANDENLVIQWPDRHISSYNYQYLWQNSFEGNLLSSSSIKKSLWSKLSFPGIENISIPLTIFKDSESGQKLLVNSILKYGVGIVSEVPPDSTESTVENLFAIKDTFYGKMWSFQADLEHADLAYSTESLGAHTDTTYFNTAVRIQVLHCLQAANGGETLLVDGFNVAEQYKESSPQGYRLLSVTKTPAEFKGEGQHCVTLDTIFKHCPVTHSLCQIRFNMNDRAPLNSIPYEKVDPYYDALRLLNSVIKKEKNEFWLKLKPGQVLFIDNWRVMHGRAKYSGPRIMGGCYIDEDSFSSKARVLGFCV